VYGRGGVNIHAEDDLAFHFACRKVIYQ
jgi:hypothetical protein